MGLSPTDHRRIFCFLQRVYLVYSKYIYTTFFSVCVLHIRPSLGRCGHTIYVLPIHVIPLSFSMMGAGRLKMERGCAFRTVIKVFSLRKNVGRRRDLAAGERISFETLDSYFFLNKKGEKSFFFFTHTP